MGAGVWAVVTSSLPTAKGRQERHRQDTGKAPRSRFAWLQGHNATGQQDLKLLICRLETVKQSTKPDRQPEALFAACSCSTEVWAITHRLFSYWQLEVTGGNPQGMALSDEGPYPALWEQRCALLVRRTEKE